MMKLRLPHWHPLREEKGVMSVGIAFWGDGCNVGAWSRVSSIANTFQFDGTSGRVMCESLLGTSSNEPTLFRSHLIQLMEPIMNSIYFEKPSDFHGFCNYIPIKIGKSPCGADDLGIREVTSNSLATCNPSHRN